MMSNLQSAVGRPDVDIDRVRAELEQARVGMEDMDHRLTELLGANQAINERLTEEVQRRRKAEARVEELTAAAMSAAAAGGSQEASLREQLSTTVEELQVMAEELQVARDTLHRTELTGTVGTRADALHPEDAEAVRAWFHRLAGFVQAVDFTGARAIFAPDMVAFGTFTGFMTGQEAAEQQQWRNVWQHIDNFRFRDDIRVLVSHDRLLAVGMGVFDSTGYRQDGTTYDRPGRATVVFVRAQPDMPWLAQHTHLSLFRDVPTRSFKNKPELQH